MTPPLETRVDTIHRDSDGIIRVKMKPHAQVGLADARESVRVIATLCEGTRRPVIVDMTELKSMDREARMYFAGAETAKVESAAALIVNSPLRRAIGNFLRGLNKPLFPTRIFTSEKEALAWIKTLVS